jgi:hypothetical protein
MKRGLPPPNPEYLKFLLPYEPRIQELALATRALVLNEAPGSTELIYDAYNAVATGYSFTGRPSDAFLHIAVYAKWVNLGFNQGSLLDDLGGVLQGKGQWVRHIRIAKAGDLENIDTRALVKAAVAQGERPDPKSGEGAAKGGSVVRAIYPRRRRPKAS